MNIRAFFALKLNDQTVRRLSDHADTLCAYDRHMEVNWVESESYHLTLCFLGDIRISQVETLERLTREQLAQFEPFHVRLNAVDYYPVSDSLALVAALTQDCAELQSLHEEVRQVAATAGISYDDTDFKPHVTLGRLPADNSFEPPCSWPELDLQSPAASVVLYLSKPGERGSLYTPLFEVPLQYSLPRVRSA
ncbi:RNA 2',3'-cyclic phosphodiesterase [Marinobacterium rhizophilum]|uniref:RNA 2',3'-cyclic phosphodiesterase n=1 Tax=Marinobacterium rhizophilum TaxID=420402 RepID=A0ABY5HPS0_9GAMM|nr:RNA 2',3'-cyclic phosphodiesterase [Marinobacterium rhizophilum]UTW13964.1 RNA 2',3'-cyclic phosphodiesterase [Marinobacterium rhizophilum]